MPLPISYLKPGAAIWYQGKRWRVAQVNWLYRGSRLVNGDVYPDRPETRLELVRPWNLWLVLEHGKAVRRVPDKLQEQRQKRKRRRAKREIWRDVIRSRMLSRKRGSE